MKPSIVCVTCRLFLMPGAAVADHISRHYDDKTEFWVTTFEALCDTAASAWRNEEGR